MSEARDQMLGSLRRALKRGPVEGEARAALEVRLAGGDRGPVPARADGGAAERLALFQSMAEDVSATVERLSDPAEIPGAVARYLSAHNLPAELKLAPAEALAAVPWDSEPLLKLRRGVAEAGDAVSVTGAFAAIAETGTLMLLSGTEGPTTLNFLPDNHIVVLKASDVVGPYEAAWDRLRVARGRGEMPRTVNFITGPSRTADIEQTIQLGAHGPRRLHILVIEDGEAA